MLVRLGHALLIAALLVATGGHWAVLQTVAWTNMLASNLRTESFDAAVAKTFDGKHPCKLCKVISAGKKTEKRSEFPTLAKKLEFVSDRLVFVFSPPQDFRLLPELKPLLSSASARPPVPPPRSTSV